MSILESISESFDPVNFKLWAHEGRSVETGPDRQQIPLPDISFPLHEKDYADLPPSDDAIGKGVYDYLRRFPDCPCNTQYAEVLRDAYPHYLTDLGAQIVMLEHKEVDAPYVRRMVSYMKIFLLLDPENGGLLQRLGLTCYDLALTFSELSSSRQHLLDAMGYFQRSFKVMPEDLTNLNCLGQIDFLFGDYPSAMNRWRFVHDRLEDAPTKDLFKMKMERIEKGDLPDHPLVDDLETVGQAMELYGWGSYGDVVLLLERLEVDGMLLKEFPMPEFHYLLGVCREKTGEAAGAFESFEKSLSFDPDFSPALEGKKRILDGEGA